MASSDFLNFVVQQTLAGNSAEIEGFTVATRVFGRGQDFDQAVDPIVSIQANKLRRALERYYLVAGQKDLVHIDIPKGAYFPVFTDRMSSRVEGKSWPTIFIRPFLNLTGDKALDWLGVGFASELRMQRKKRLLMPKKRNCLHRIVNLPEWYWHLSGLLAMKFRQLAGK